MFLCAWLLYVFLYFHFFFFKQKTAYEMRISDWSSDVCSSDLPGQDHDERAGGSGDLHPRTSEQRHRNAGDDRRVQPLLRLDPRRDRERHRQRQRDHADDHTGDDVRQQVRSEEHTSELQSLMRISYAVFCLKKNNTEPNTSNK